MAVRNCNLGLFYLVKKYIYVLQQLMMLSKVHLKTDSQSQIKQRQELSLH